MSTRYQFFKSLAARSGFDLSEIFEIESRLHIAGGKKPRRAVLSEAVYRCADAYWDAHDAVVDTCLATKDAE